jgi:hypothetical protein
MTLCLEAKFAQNAGLWEGLESDKNMTYFHDPSGERVVGIMNQVNSRVIFLGFGRY